MEIFDTHAHILDKVYDEAVLSPSSDGAVDGVAAKTRRDEILERAARENFYIIESALNETEWNQVARLAAKPGSKNLFFTIGIHPHDASKYSAENKKISELIGVMKDVFISNKNIKRCLAIGEMGLDYHYKDSSPSDQKKIFRLQVELALSSELSAPVVIHCRDAYEDCFEILKSYSDRWRGVIHCFSGDVKIAEKLLNMGFYLSFTGIVTFKNNEKIKSVLKITPNSRILAETDSPYLTPSPHRGKRNEPLFVKYIYQEIAKIKEIDLSELVKIISENFKTIFS